MLERIAKVVALARKRKGDSALFAFGRIVHAITDLERWFDNRDMLQVYSEEIENYECDEDAKIDAILKLSFHPGNASCEKYMHQRLKAADMHIF